MLEVIKTRSLNQCVPTNWILSVVQKLLSVAGLQGAEVFKTRSQTQDCDFLHASFSCAGLLGPDKPPLHFKLTDKICLSREGGGNCCS
jgi:hypothetical protein